MILYALGILTGILLTFVGIFVALSYGPGSREEFEETFKKLKPRKGVEFFDPGNTELDALESLYEENKKRGVDTPV